MGKQIKNPLLGRGFQLIGSQPPKGGAFVPEYTSLIDVPEDVTYLYYNGETTAEATKGFFYRRVWVEPQYDVRTYNIPPDTLCINIRRPDFGIPMGVYTYVENYPLIDEIREKFNDTVYLYRIESVESSDGEKYVSGGYGEIFRVGDVFANATTKERFEVASIIDESRFRLSNGVEIKVEVASGSYGSLDAYVNDTGVIVYNHEGSTNMPFTELRVLKSPGYPDKLYGYSPAIYFKGIDFQLIRTSDAEEITVSTLIADGYWKWVQTDTQPRNTDYKLVSPDGSKYVIVENTGTTVNGNLSIVGDLTVSGKETVVEIVDVESENDYITLRKNNPLPLGTDRAGITIENYDGQGTHLVLNVGSDGVARVGDEGDEQPLMTRDEAGNLSEGVCLIWDAANKKAVGITLDDLFAKYVQSHTMTEAEYWAAVEAGTLKANNLYFTPVN